MQRLEAWLRTGPFGHLLGGAIDLSSALVRALLARYVPRAGRGT
ncbi:MAG TPA: hypothetical protein VMI13_13705 [Solirubrobacteraceae bacterium]|nr:hypothetical protein [Solirubrobacteraceae bacterium]